MLLKFVLLFFLIDYAETSIIPNGKVSIMTMRIIDTTKDTNSDGELMGNYIKLINEPVRICKNVIIRVRSKNFEQ